MFFCIWLFLLHVMSVMVTYAAGSSHLFAITGIHQQVANVYVRGQIENILGFEGYIQSLLYILLCSLWVFFGWGTIL